MFFLATAPVVPNVFGSAFQSLFGGFVTGLGHYIFVILGFGMALVGVELLMAWIRVCASPNNGFQKVLRASGLDTGVEKKVEAGKRGNTEWWRTTTRTHKLGKSRDTTVSSFVYSGARRSTREVLDKQERQREERERQFKQDDEDMASEVGGEDYFS